MRTISALISGCALTYLGFLLGNTYSYHKAKNISEPNNTNIHAIILTPPKEDKHDELDLSMWKTVEYDNRNFYFTDSPTPNHFEDQMNYIWNGRGCYAFLPEEFTFEEIYQLVMHKPYKKQLSDFEKFSGTIENI